MLAKSSIQAVLLLTLCFILMVSADFKPTVRDIPVESFGEELKKYSTDQVLFLTSDETPTTNVGLHSNKPSLNKGRFNDILWKMQWYLQDYRLNNGPVMDLNVLPVYDKNINGKGVYIAVVDDGIQVQPDLKRNFMEAMSYNFVDSVSGSVRPDATGFVSSHGTKVAGVIAMEENNGICGVGIAHGASIADVKVIGRQGTKVLHEAAGLLHRQDRVDIYSNSYGPQDSADHMNMLKPKTSESLRIGATLGRSGKGAIYVYPAGNGKAIEDNCGADAHINDPYTLAFASVSQWGLETKYSERCAAIIATVYSVGQDGDEGIVSTDLEGRCTMGFSSRAAAAPIASGIIALLLQARKELTRRDVMHIITRTAEVAPLAANPQTWLKNGASFWVSHDFGFGLFNAKNMIDLAMIWKLVDTEVVCEQSKELPKPVLLKENSDENIQWDIDSCNQKVFYLEQISVFCDIDYPYRGALTIVLVSPSGTKVNLLTSRERDHSDTTGMKRWGFKSLHTWSEQPKGAWHIIVKVKNIQKGPVASLIDGISNLFESDLRFTDFKGKVKGFKMAMRGTTSRPQGVKDKSGQPWRSYAAFRLPNDEGSHFVPNPV